LEGLKEQVVRRFLKSFVSGYVLLEQAQIATLGGKGVEAKIWHDLAIPVENGWLIERSRKHGSKLAGHHYRTQNQLRTFDRILAGYGEHRDYIDAFHLDLCGTLSNKSMKDFAPVLPLVLKSKGRCLAITVADARRNLVLEQWPDFQNRAKKLFGNQANNIYEELSDRQHHIPVNLNAPTFIRPFDPIKATKREFGLLVELTELLKIQGFPWIPVTIERYVYVSRYQRRPFRMRTYFFHFEKQHSKFAEKEFAKTWISSRLFFGIGEEFKEVVGSLVVEEVGTTIQKNQNQKGEKEMTFKNIDDFMIRAKELVGPQIMAEYNQLVDNSQRLKNILDVAGLNNNLFTTSDQEPLQETVVKEKKTSRKTKKMWADLTEREQIEWQLKALELKKESGEKWKVEREKMITRDFGHCDPALSGSLRAVLARTSGGHRASFEATIQNVFGNEAKPYLDRLAKL